MNNAKNPFASKTIWGLIITLVGIIANKFDVPVDKDELRGLLGFLEAHWEDILEVVGILLAAWGRFRAAFPLSFRAPQVHPLWVLFLGVITPVGAGEPRAEAAFYRETCVINDNCPPLFLGESLSGLPDSPACFPDLLVPFSASAEPRVSVFSSSGVHIYLDTRGKLSGYCTFSDAFSAPPGVIVGF